MKVAICDDEPKELTRLSFFFSQYSGERKVGLIYKSFSNATDLLEDIRKEQFDTIFLDIMMPGVSGMQAAREIRSYEKNIPIIFLTSSSEFAVESYAVKAYTYLLKPIEKETLFLLVDQLMADICKQKGSLSVKSKGGLVRILFYELSHIEVLGKSVFFHLSDGSIQEVTATLGEFEDLLTSRHEFLRVHRSFIVNMDHMHRLTKHDFISLSGKTIPVSRRLYPQVREAYMKHFFVELGVEK